MNRIRTSFRLWQIRIDIFLTCLFVFNSKLASVGGYGGGKSVSALSFSSTAHRRIPTGNIGVSPYVWSCAGCTSQLFRPPNRVPYRRPFISTRVLYSVENSYIRPSPFAIFIAILPFVFLATLLAFHSHSACCHLQMHRIHQLHCRVVVLPTFASSP